MTKVELFERIRIDHKIKGISIRGISRQCGIHRRVVRQALDNAVPPARKIPQRECPKLDPVKVHIDRWLKEDKDKPRKQRHTAKRIYDRVRSEYNADIAESTVRAYVAKRKRELGLCAKDVYIPQVHLPAKEAEVDFYEADVEFDWGVETVNFFSMRASFSAKEFHRGTPLKDQQAFLEGHTRAFDYFGGVFERVRYDNLTPAVKKVLRGRRREETRAFIALRSHYLFESFFCQPGIEGAHEKGGVENTAGRFRRNHLVPIPKAKDYDDLNNKLLIWAAEDDLRLPQGRAETPQQMWEEEALRLRPLPKDVFATDTVAMPRVDAKSRVKVKCAYYSVPSSLAGLKVEARIGSTQVALYYKGSLVATHPRKKRGEESLRVEHYIDVLRIKPGALKGSKPLHQLREEGLFPAELDELWASLTERHGTTGADKEMIEVLALLKHFSMQEIAFAARLSLLYGCPSAPAINQLILQLKEPQREEISVGELTVFNRPMPTTDIYDTLRVPVGRA